MKKNDASKKTANLLKNIAREELTGSTGGLLSGKPCLTCGLINKVGTTI